MSEVALLCLLVMLIEIHARRMTATTLRRIATLARRTGFQPGRRVCVAPDWVVTAPIARHFPIKHLEWRGGP